MEILKKEIKTYILKEISQIGKPKNPNQTYEFKDLSGTIDLLFLLLDEDITEKSLQRVKENFYSHLQKILNFDIPEMPVAIEGLATNFEPFLKLLAFLRYGQTEYWEPDALYSDGISKTTLHNLIEGKINNKYSAPAGTPLKEIPDPILENKGIQRGIFSFIRTELRNAVHNAKSYSRVELLMNSHIVIAGYLFAIEDNTPFLKKRFLKEFQYLKNILNNKSYLDLDKVYVELLGLEGFKEIEVLGSEVISEENLLMSIDDFSEILEEEREEIEDEVVKERRIDSISLIQEDTKQFVIIGSPGAGKTTTLLNLFYQNARKVLEGTKGTPIPFFINANEYHPSNTFYDILCQSISQEWIDFNLPGGRIQLMIDGINEIKESHKNEAYKEIDKLVEKYPDISIILSERKINFQRRFDIPVFELQDLNEGQIHEFIKNYAGSKYSLIWNQLQRNPDMLKLASSPLMLKMILTVSRGGNLPQNRGLLYQVFINSIFEREKAKQDQIRKDTKIDVLAKIAYEMRKMGSVSISISKFKKLSAEALASINSPISINLFYQEILDNLIIKANQNENVSFFHETYQEYFSGIQVKKEFEIYGKLDFQLDDNNWFEALLLCGEVTRDQDRAKDFISYLLRGEEISGRKILSDFDQNDFNPNISNVCKIAYALKNSKPELYTIAEKTIYNYAVLYKYFYFNKQIEIIPLENLFAAIASINSTRIFSYILNNYGWAHIWLFSEFEEKNNFFWPTDLDQDKNMLFKTLSTSICSNLPKLENLYDLLLDSQYDYQFSKSVYWRVQNLKGKLRKTLPENELKKYYEKSKEFEILLEIVKNNFDEALNYEFGGNEEQDNTVWEIIIKRHISNEVAQNIIIKELKKGNFKTKILKLIITTSYEKNQIDLLIQVMEYLLENQKEEFNRNINWVRALSFELLSPSLQDYFAIQKDKPLEVAYKGLKTSKVGTKYHLIIDAEDKNNLREGETYFLNSNLIISISGISPYELQTDRSIILISKNGENLEQNLSETGIIKIQFGNEKFLFNYKGYRKLRRKNAYEFRFDRDEVVFKKYRNIQYDVSVNHCKFWEYEQFGYINETDHSRFLVSFTCDIKNYFSDIPSSGLINGTERVNSNFILKATHPDVIKQDTEKMKFLKRKLTETVYQQYIIDNGLSHYFHKSLPDIHYGVIIDSFNNNYKIFSFKLKKFINRYLFGEKFAGNIENRIVVIMDEPMVRLIQVEDEHFEKIGYVTSEILNLNNQKEEGFIRKEEGIKDYYFHLNNCNYEPNTGDRVTFLPVLNWSKNHINEPMAIKVQKLETI